MRCCRHLANGPGRSAGDWTGEPVSPSAESHCRHLRDRCGSPWSLLLHETRVTAVLRGEPRCGWYLVDRRPQLGPRYLGWQHGRPDQLRRTVVAPIAAGAAAFGSFYVGAQIARRIPVLNAAITSVMRYTHEGSVPLMMATVVVNAIGEEVFFRGALFDAVDDRRRGLSTSTAVYSLVITATRNPALVLASGIMGTLFARQRRATGGIQAPTLTHVTWSMLMLRFLPPLFRPGGRSMHTRACRSPGGWGRFLLTLRIGRSDQHVHHPAH